MERKPLISVVVPVYGTEKYLRKCLDSILTQTYGNIELIVVNDASNDNSEDIIKEYLQKYDNIKYVKHSKNRGLFRARISGAEEATGEYIAFVDSDDYISCDFYRLLVKKAIKTGSDITVSDWVYQFENGQRIFTNLDNFRVKDIDLTGTDIMDAFMKQHGECFSWHTVWNKVYRKSLWDECSEFFISCSDKREPLIMCEDLIFSSTLWAASKKVVNEHGAEYFYCRHDQNSVVCSSNDINKYKKNILDIKHAFDCFKLTLENHNLFDKYKDDYIKFKEFYSRVWFNICNGMTNKQEALRIYDEVFKEFNHVNIKSSDHFFSKYTTELDQTYNWHEEIKFQICDPDIEYVSFDIFDTLICRPFWEPTDLFDLMSLEFNKLIKSTSFVNFKEIRQECEQGCRSYNVNNFAVEDINLDEIYDYMAEDYGFSKDVCEKLKELEIKLELRFCTERKFGKSLFELAKECGKKIIVISDMYLTENTINHILKKNGYTGIEKIYVSSEQRLLKGTGNLYKKVLNDLKIENHSTVLHIGDNWNADIVAASEIGLKTFHIPKAKEVFCNDHGNIYGGEYYKKAYFDNISTANRRRAVEDFLGIRCMLAMVANKIFDEGYCTINKTSDFNCDPYFVGYFPLGMHLLSVANWMLQESKKYSYEKVHFVARDGWLPKKAFDILTSALNCNVKSDYFYISRKVTMPLQIRNKSDLYSIKPIILFSSFSPKKLINNLKFALKPEAVKNAEDICWKNKFLYDNNFTSESSFNRFLRLISDEFWSKKQAQKYSHSIKNYFDKKIGNNDAIFDIGYSARNESIFSYLLNKKINTYYIHTNQDIAYKRAQMFDFNIHSFYDHGPSACVVLREHIFCELGPSCISYDIDDNGNVTPQFEEYKENYPTYFVTKTMQDAALDFVSDFVQIFSGYYDQLIYRRSDASIPYEYFLHNAKWFDRQMFSESSFEDDMWGGVNVNFVNYWEDNLKACGCFDKIKEVKDLKPSDYERDKNFANWYYEKMLFQKINGANDVKSAFFLDKVLKDDSEADKFLKCANNTSNIVDWNAIEELINPVLINNWYMTNPGGFTDEEFGVFLTTNLSWIQENTDITYLDKVLERIGDSVLLPVNIGFTTDREKIDFVLTEGSVNTLKKIAERCKSVGVKGEYTAEILSKYGIKNSVIVGCPSMYKNILEMKKISSNKMEVGNATASFKPFYGELFDKEIDLLKFFEKNKFNLVETTNLELSELNIKDEKVYSYLKAYENTKKIYFDINSWRDSFEDADFVMGMNFYNNVVALQSGIPALFVCYETTGREMCKFFNLPNIDISEFNVKKSVSDYCKLADYSSFVSSIDQKYDVFRKFLSENGVKINRVVEK